MLLLFLFVPLPSPFGPYPSSRSAASLCLEYGSVAGRKQRTGSKRTGKRKGRGQKKKQKEIKENKEQKNPKINYILYSCWFFYSFSFPSCFSVPCLLILSRFIKVWKQREKHKPREDKISKQGRDRRRQKPTSRTCFHGW